MRSDIVPGGIFPDYELPDHTGTLRILSELQGNDPLILTLARGQYCPKPHFLRWSPSHHWTDQKIRVHAFYCVLALLLSSVLHREVWQKGEKLSLSRLLEELGQIRETLVIYPRRKGQHRPSTANCLTRMSPLQRRLFSLLDLPRYAKGVLTQSN